MMEESPALNSRSSGSPNPMVLGTSTSPMILRTSTSPLVLRTTQSHDPQDLHQPNPMVLRTPSTMLFCCIQADISATKPQQALLSLRGLTISQDTVSTQ